MVDMDQEEQDGDTLFVYVDPAFLERHLRPSWKYYKLGKSTHRRKQSAR
jgi:hypothetical protein